MLLVYEARCFDTIVACSMVPEALRCRYAIQSGVVFRFTRHSGLGQLNGKHSHVMIQYHANQSEV